MPDVIATFLLAAEVCDAFKSPFSTAIRVLPLTFYCGCTTFSDHINDVNVQNAVLVKQMVK